MIPGIQLRKIRPCEECVFFDSLEEFCILHEDSVYAEKIERWESEDQSVPCPYHFSADEIIELIIGFNNSDSKLPSNTLWVAQ